MQFTITSYFLKKKYFWGLISKMKVTCMSIAFLFLHICLLFWLLGCDIRMHILILTRVQKGPIAAEKLVEFSQKIYFWGLISNMKLTCMPIACFVFSFFALNTCFCNSQVVAYVPNFPLKQGVKMDESVAQ